MQSFALADDLWCTRGSVGRRAKAGVRTDGSRCSPLDALKRLILGSVDNREHDFEAIWRDVGPILWRAVYAYCGARREVADDVVVEASARAMERDRDIRDPRAYLFRVAFRLAATEMKLDARRQELVDQAVEEAPRLHDLLRALRQRRRPSARRCTCTTRPTCPCGRLPSVTHIENASPSAG